MRTDKVIEWRDFATVQESVCSTDRGYRRVRKHFRCRRFRPDGDTRPTFMAARTNNDRRPLAVDKCGHVCFGLILPAGREAEGYLKALWFPYVPRLRSVLA